MNEMTLELKKIVEKCHYVFTGEKATNRTPLSTGNILYYGSYLAFKTKKEALNYAENFNEMEICVSGTAMSLRKFSLGISLCSYLDMLYYAETL